MYVHKHHLKRGQQLEGLTLRVNPWLWDWAQTSIIILNKNSTQQLAIVFYTVKEHKTLTLIKQLISSQSNLVCLGPW